MGSSIMKWGCCGILFFVSVACQGKPSSPTAPVPQPTPLSDTSSTKPETAPGGVVPSGDTAEIATKWMEGMKSVLPSLFCKQGSYFRECFRISEQECEDEAIRVTRVCVDSKRADLLKNFKAEEGKMWGEKVGECAGSSFEISLEKKKIESPKCNDASQWM
jgi:hypothetical protein